MLKKDKIKITWENIKNSDAGMYLCIALIAVIVFIKIYGINVLKPTYVDWLMAGGDLNQHYLGWLAYRASKWHFPIGMVDMLAYPYKTSIIFTDSIPIFALFFKIFSPILPNKFQYFGLWGICCFMLQGLFAGRIIRHKTESKLITVVASTLFLFTPVMIWRMYAHTALAGQWIIIYALDIVLNPDKYQSKKKIYTTIAAMGFLSASIHLYFVLMNGIVLTGYIIIDFLSQKKFKRSLFSLAIYLVSIASAVYIFGGFNMNGTSAYEGGLGYYSFNLNNFVNPQGWSKIFKDLALCGGQYEGFAYLGAGIILLTFLAIYSCLILHKKMPNVKKIVVKEKNIQIIAISVVFILSIIISMSPTVTIGNTVLAEFRLPNIIIAMWSIFRSSGRIVWVAVYLIMFLAIFSLLKVGRKKLICLILGLLSILQIYDISDILTKKYAQFKDKTEYQTLLTTTDFWNQLANNKEIKHILYYSYIDQNMMYSITNWALENGKTLNDFYFARSMHNAVSQNREQVLSVLPADTIYIFSTNDWAACAACKQYNLHYYNIDDLIVGCVNAIDGFSEIK